MFKSWRSDKKKIKMVFQLQFQATQVPRLKKSAVTIALVPDDVGKPTRRLEKVAVQNGSCLWENPVYETVKLIREQKTGKLSEKIYHFVVSNGSSKAGFLGEASIDFSDFAAETEPITVSLPLKFANSGAILHVTVHKIEEASDQKYLGESEGFAISRDGSLQSQDNNYSIHESDRNFIEDEHFNMTTYRNAEQNGSINASNGSTATSASCWDIGSEQLKKTSIGQDPAGFFSPIRQNSMPQRRANAAMTKKNMHCRTNTDWSASSTSDGSLVESGNSPEDIPRQWQDESENSFEKLRSENAMLLRQVEVSELELQSLRKQVLKEGKRTQDLSRQIISLKEERDAVKTEFERLKSKKNTDEAETECKLEAENDEPKVLLEEIRQELNHEKDLNTNLRLQLQKTQDSNSNLILAVRDLNEMLEQKNREISHLSSEIEASMSIEEVNSSSKCQKNEAEDQNALKEFKMEEHDANEVHMMKQTITDLNAELEFYRKHKEELEMHIKELSRENDNISFQLKQNQQQESMKTQIEYSESLATINELESQVQRLEDKIKQQSEEYSESSIAINELESQVKELKKELENQTQGFEDDLNAMIHARTEQEQRAIRAEEALRRTRWKNAVTAERLQEEFKRLSVEMDAKFDENEKRAMKAVAEADELHIQNRNLEEMLEKANEELRLLKDKTEIERQDLSHQLDLKAKEMERMSMELKDKTRQLEYAQKQEKGKREAFSKEIQMPRTEIEKLREQRSQCTNQAKENGKQSDETKMVKISSDKTETLIQRWNEERDELEKKITLAKKEAVKAQKQLISTRSLKDKKEMVITNLQSEIENIRAEYNNLKHSLNQEAIEKEKLRKQVSQLKNDLRKKEEEIGSIQKELKSNGGQVDVNARSSHSTSAPQESKDITSLQKKLRLLKEQITLKEAALKISANPSPEKERNLGNMIEELDSSMEQLKICHCFSANQCQKVRGLQESTSSGIFPANVNKSEERGKPQDDMLHSKIPMAEGMPFSAGAVPVQSNSANLVNLQSEVEHLKERNKSMERELKDMEERYSKISLKFAEVEGERQQLVMTVRNLKNGKKN